MCNDTNKPLMCAYKPTDVNSILVSIPYLTGNTASTNLRNTVALNSYLGLSALSQKKLGGLYKIWQGRQLFAKTFWTHCEYSLESLNFVAFTKPNKHKMTLEDFSIDCSQSPIFLWDRRCRSLSPTGRHLGLLMWAKLGRVQNACG